LPTDIRPVQIKNALEKFDFCHSEFVIGLVCALGTDYAPVRFSIEKILSKFNYSNRTIKISNLIARLTGKPVPRKPRDTAN
jgi:hypothetical protein